MLINRKDKIGVKNHATRSSLFKEYADMELKKNDSNFSLNIISPSLTNRFILLMEFPTLILNYRNSLNKYQQRKIKLFYQYRNYANL